MNIGRKKGNSSRGLREWGLPSTLYCHCWASPWDVSTSFLASASALSCCWYAVFSIFDSSLRVWAAAASRLASACMACRHWPPA